MKRTIPFEKYEELFQRPLEQYEKEFISAILSTDKIKKELFVAARGVGTRSWQLDCLLATIALMEFAR